MTMDNLPHEDMPLFRDPPAQEHSKTSKAAARSMRKPKTASLRDQVMAFIRIRGGATDEEIQIALDMPASTQRPRRVELMQAGLVRDSGEVRNTKSGRKAVVWKAT